MSLFLSRFREILSEIILEITAEAPTYGRLFSYCNKDFILCYAKRHYVPCVHKERQKQNEVFSHTPHLLFTGGLLTAFEDLPLLLNGIIS